MAELTHLVVRAVHVIAVATLLGGAVAAWAAVRLDGTDALTVARRYEAAFWGLFGLAAVTGVGNLGALGPPGPTTPWGVTLTWKLGLVLAFLVGSLVRSIAVVRTGTSEGEERDGTADRAEAVDGGPSREAVRRFARRAYGLTALALVAIVVLAEVLAHG